MANMQDGSVSITMADSKPHPPPLNLNKASSFNRSFNRTVSYSTIKKNRKPSLAKRLVSVRLLLLVSFAVLVIFMGLLTYFISTGSIRNTSDSLSKKILENVVVRVAAQVEALFAYPYELALDAATQIDKKELLTFDYLRVGLWKIWSRAGNEVQSLNIVLPNGNGIGYYHVVVPVDIQFEIWYNVSTASPYAIFGPVVNYETGAANLSDPATTQIIPSNLDLRYTDWYPKALAARKQIWSDVYRLPFGEQTLYFTTSHPVFNSSGHIIAEFAASYTSTRVQEFLQSIDVSDNAKLWLTQPNGALVACSDLDEQIYDPNNTKITTAQDSNLQFIRESTRKFFETDQNETGDTSIQFSFTLNKKEISVYVYEMTANDLDLLLFVAYPKSDFLHEVAVVQRKTLIVTITVLAGAFAVGLWVMFLVTSPLSKLGDQMNDISAGDFDSVALNKSARKSSRLYEIHALQLDFQRMVNAVRSFGKYVPVDIVKHLLQADEIAEAQVSQKDLTVMFSDIKGFTQKVEEMTPTQLSMLLSDYLNAMCAVIANNSGTIDKFIGDAIMALWNVPAPVDKHVSCACTTALQSLKVLKELNKKWTMNGLPEIQCRIGIHTGKALVGNLGSNERLSYTAIGDNINLASRLEALNKRYDTSILISGQVYEIVQSEYLCRYLDTVVVQGRSTPTQIYELVARIGEATAEQIHLCARQSEAVAYFFNKQFVDCLAILKSLQQTLPNDISIKLMIERATEASAMQISSTWTGYSVLVEK